MEAKTEVIEEEKDIRISASIPPELHSKLVAYAKNYAQGNKSFAVRLAIELLISMSEQQQNK